jgi:hypothetical protein
MSLASIKRRAVVGAKLQIVRHDWPMLRLNQTEEEYQAKRDAFFAVREIVISKPTEIGFRTGEKISYLSWPKSNAVRETANGFDVDLKGDGAFSEIISYEWR